MPGFTLTVEGNLVAKPELEITATGQNLCRLRIAHNRRRRTADGQWTDAAPMWIQVTTWGDLAERCAGLNKGDTVVVDGRDDLGAWAFTRQDGTAGAALEVTAANVSVSMRFRAALPVADEAPAAGAWDPHTADPDCELQAA